MYDILAILKCACLFVYIYILILQNPMAIYKKRIDLTLASSVASPVFANLGASGSQDLGGEYHGTCDVTFW